MKSKCWAAAANTASRFHIFCARLENAIMFCLHHKISVLLAEEREKIFSYEKQFVIELTYILEEGFAKAREIRSITIPFLERKLFLSFKWALLSFLWLRAIKLSFFLPLCIPRSPFRRLLQFCVQKVTSTIKLTISVEAPVAETHPTMISEPMRLPRNVKAKLTHPVVTTCIWKDKNGRNVRKAS